MNKIILVTFLITLFSCTSKSDNKEVAPNKVLEEKGDLLCECMSMTPENITDECKALSDSIKNATENLNEDELTAFMEAFDKRMDACDRAYFENIYNDKDGLTICECFEAEQMQRYHSEVEIECELLKKEIGENEIIARLNKCDAFKAEETRRAEEMLAMPTVCDCFDQIYDKTISETMKSKCQQLEIVMDSTEFINEAQKCASFQKMFEGDNLK